MLKRISLVFAIITLVVIMANAQNPEQKAAIDKEIQPYQYARIYPVYKIDLSEDSLPEPVLDTNSYVIFTETTAYTFYQGKASSWPYQKTVQEPFCAYYLTAGYSNNGPYIPLRLTDTAFSNISSIITEEYGSIEKYKELLVLDYNRSEISPEELPKAIQHNYWAYKDTIAALHALVDEISDATPLATTEQARLFYYFEKRLKNYIPSPSGGCFYLLKLDITSDLLTLLTDREFQAYKNYKNTWHPLNFNGLHRYSYAKEMYTKERKTGFNEYVDSLQAKYIATLSGKKFEMPPSRRGAARRNYYTEGMDTAIRYDFHLYEARCPGDTALIFRTFIHQLRLATGLTAGQENLLMKRLALLYGGSHYKYGLYDIHLYNVNITADVMNILTDEQFSAYNHYIALHATALDVYKEENGAQALHTYIDNLMKECGCK